MMKDIGYYKVHKYSIKFLNKITPEQIEIFVNVCDGKYADYKKGDYIYISFNDDGPLGFMTCKNNDEKSSDYYDSISYKYFGELDIQKNRRKKIEKINESNL